MHPMIRVLRVHQQHGKPGIIPDPLALVPMRGRVHQHLAVRMVEPHRCQAGSAIRSGDRECHRHRLIQQLPVDRRKIVQAGAPAFVADRELALLQAVRHMAKIRDGKSISHIRASLLSQSGDSFRGFDRLPSSPRILRCLQDTQRRYTAQQSRGTSSDSPTRFPRQGSEVHRGRIPPATPRPRSLGRRPNADRRRAVAAYRHAHGYAHTNPSPDAQPYGGVLIGDLSLLNGRRPPGTC